MNTLVAWTVYRSNEDFSKNFFSYLGDLNACGWDQKSKKKKTKHESQGRRNSTFVWMLAGHPTAIAETLSWTLWCKWTMKSEWYREARHRSWHPPLFSVIGHKYINLSSRVPSERLICKNHVKHSLKHWIVRWRADLRTWLRKWRALSLLCQLSWLAGLDAGVLGCERRGRR